MMNRRETGILTNSLTGIGLSKCHEMGDAIVSCRLQDVLRIINEKGSQRVKGLASRQRLPEGVGLFGHAELMGGKHQIKPRCQREFLGFYFQGKWMRVGNQRNIEMTCV